MLRRLSSIAATVNSIEDNYSELTDAELRELTDQYKQRYADGAIGQELSIHGHRLLHGWCRDGAHAVPAPIVANRGSSSSR